LRASLAPQLRERGLEGLVREAFLAGGFLERPPYRLAAPDAADAVAHEHVHREGVAPDEVLDLDGLVDHRDRPSCGSGNAGAATGGVSEVYHYLVFGGGRMGIAIAADLARRDDTAGVVVVDREASALAEAETACEAAGVPRRALRVARHALEDGPALQALLRAADVAVSAVPYEHNPRLTDLAIEQGTHLIDLGGNPGIVRLQGRRADTAREAGVAVVPDCGLAPGLANVIAGHEIRAAPWATPCSSAYTA
jgi:hypothetical protein